MSQSESKEELTILRNHLLELTRAEPQLQSIKERSSLEVTTIEPSILDVLQLWQRVFRETFQQYQRLSARLVHSQDVGAALRLWQEYLDHVQDYLSSNVPEDYNGLSEERNLCEVHENLLTEQQSLIKMVRVEEGKELSVTEKFNDLSELHNECLSLVSARHSSVRDRMTVWERYKADQGKLLSWLKDVDRDRARLQLRFISARRLEKTLSSIDNLLERLPNGEIQADRLHNQHNVLLKNCDEALAVSVRMEHAAIAQRLSNCRASLETWKDFVTKISTLNDKHVAQSSKLTSVFQVRKNTLLHLYFN